MKQAEIVFSNPFMANQYSAEVLQPGIQSFDFPSAPVSPQRASILGGGFGAVSAVRSLGMLVGEA